MPINVTTDITTTGFDEDAVVALGPETVSVSAAVTTTGDIADGVVASGDAVAVQVFAEGSIETSGRGARGVVGVGDNIVVVNEGSIRTSGGPFDVDPPTIGDELFANAVSVTGNDFRIENYGLMSVEGGAASPDVADGSEAVIFADGTGGDVLNYGTISADADYATGVHLTGEGSRGVNDGVIDIVGRQSTGVFVYYAFDPEANSASVQFENGGLIQVTGDGSVGVQLLDFAGRVVNSGQIRVDGDLAYGFVGGGEAADFENSGEIRTTGDGAVGVSIGGDGDRLDNSGLILSTGGVAANGRAVAAVSAGGVFVSVLNRSTGRIETTNADAPAVRLNGGFTEAFLTNDGLIRAVNTAVLGADGVEVVRNSGLIIGDVDLGEGDDVFDSGDSGRVDGRILGGDGDDQLSSGDGNDVLFGEGGQDSLAGGGGTDRFGFGVSADTGDDVVADFQSDDLLVTDAALTDGNGDGFITFGGDGVLDLDGPDAGGDTVALAGVAGAEGLRFLGTEGGEFFYALARTRPESAVESRLGDEMLSGDAGDARADVFFFDTRLDLDLGQDRIERFGARDILVATTPLFDADGDGVIRFGADRRLDLSGDAEGDAPGDGGSIGIASLAGGTVRALEFDGAATRGGVTYFVYSLVGSAAGVDDLAAC